MSKNTVTGLAVWVMRQNEWSDYRISEGKRPRWTSESGWTNQRGYLTTICPEMFRKYLGVHPPKHLREGGKKAIQRATLYVALDWEGLK